MHTIMDDSGITSVDEIGGFLVSSERIQFQSLRVDDQYKWICQTLIRFEYLTLSKKRKGIVRKYLQKFTAYSRAQLTRLISKYQRKGVIRRNIAKRYRFPKKFSRQDILLLAKTDELHNFLSGPATKKIFEREYRVFGDIAFKNIQTISVAHLYNLRRHKIYTQKAVYLKKTNPVQRPFGERKKPRPNGRPGYIRIDTVHQGDRNGKKGVYHVNAVDCVTQWEVVVSVEQISEAYLLTALQEMFDQFPFRIFGFHSDNGSEYVNKTVAALLNKLLIRFTKSRARRTNDNALVESKNGAVIRKHLGYAHIPQRYASQLNHYQKEHLNLYINYHRPCFFAEIRIDRLGKERKIYKYKNMMTPYEKLKSIPKVESDLKGGVTLEKLDAIATSMSDNQFAERMVRARSNLFEQMK